MTNPKPQTELGVGEYVESDSEPETAIKSETKPETDEYQEELRDDATEVKDISLKDGIKTEKTDKDLKLKMEVRDTKVQRKEIVAWPKHIHSDDCNNDSEDTLPWSPLSSPRTDIIASTVPWIDVISRGNAEIVNSVEEISLFGSESEQEEGLENTKVKFKTAYVVIQKLKLPGLRFCCKDKQEKKKEKNQTTQDKMGCQPRFER